MWVSLGFPSWNFLSFLYLYMHVFLKFGKFGGIISSNKLAAPFFWDFQSVYIVLFNGVSQVTYSVFIFLLYFSSLYLISNGLFSNLPILSSLCSGLLLNSFSEFFNSLIIFFTFRVSVDYFCLFYGILILFICHFPDFL